VARAGLKTATARGARIGRGAHATASRVAVWPVPRVPLLATRGPRSPGPRQGLSAPPPPGAATSPPPKRPTSSAAHGGGGSNRWTRDAVNGGAARPSRGRGVSGVGRCGHRRVPRAGSHRGDSGGKEDRHRARGSVGHGRATPPLDDAASRAGRCRSGGGGRRFARRRGVGRGGKGRRLRAWRIGGAASRVGGARCDGSVVGGVRGAVALGARGESSPNGDVGPSLRPGPYATDAAAASGASAGTTERSP